MPMTRDQLLMPLAAARATRLTGSGKYRDVKRALQFGPPVRGKVRIDVSGDYSILSRQLFPEYEYGY
jgi:hypothetical protein